MYSSEIMSSDEAAVVIPMQIDEDVQQRPGKDTKEGKVVVHFEWVKQAGPAYKGAPMATVPQAARTAKLPDG